MSDDLNIPTGLTRKGRRAAQAILAMLGERKATHTGGCRTFYSPQEWADRGESYGHASLLIVVHDGGDVGRFFNGAANDYEPCETMRERLQAVGCYPVACTTWYTAICAD